MKKVTVAAALTITLLGSWAGRLSAVPAGSKAPDFTLNDSNGKQRKLSDYRGKLVVLEWLNCDCPFVKKHYGSGNMQKLQKAYTGKGIVWLSIVSSAKGKQGAMTPEEANRFISEKGATPTALLLDPAGAVGRLYQAKTTPHMFIVDRKGVLVYNGAIDDKPSTDVKDVATARNYVRDALEDALADKPVGTPVTKPYGCSVKY